MKIKIVKGGPYMVTGGAPLNCESIAPGKDGIPEKWVKGKKYQTGNTYALCRCGRSSNKPFCDGAHTRAGFKGEETADNTPYDKAAVVYKGKKIDLMDKEDLCAIARFCDKGAHAWNLAADFEDEASVNLAIREACLCPSGRLTAVKNGKKIEPAPEKEISLVQDPEKKHRGPLWVKGGIEIEGADGRKYETRNRATLCRCGESRNAPFCDGSHLGCLHMRGTDE